MALGEISLKPLWVIMAIVLIIALSGVTVVVTGKGVEKTEKGGEKLSETPEYTETVESHPLYVACKKFYNEGFAREYYTKNAGRFNAIIGSCCKNSNFCSEYKKCAINCGVLLTVIGTHVLGKSLLDTDPLLALAPYFLVVWTDPSKNYVYSPETLGSNSPVSYSLENLCTYNGECVASDIAKTLCETARDLYWGTGTGSTGSQGDTIEAACESTINDICLSITSGSSCDFNQLIIDPDSASIPSPAARIRAWYIEYILLGGNVMGLDYAKQNTALQNLAMWLGYISATLSTSSSNGNTS